MNRRGRESYEGHTESLQHRRVFSVLLFLPELSQERHTQPGRDGTEEATGGTGAWTCKTKFEHKSFAQLCIG